MVFADLLQSNFSVEITTKKGEAYDPELVIRIVYDGQDAYIDTELFDIGKVRLENVQNIVEYWRDVITDSSTQDPVNAPQNSSPAKYAVNNLKTYIDLMFFDGGITIALAKAALVNAISFLGIDISPYFEEIDFGANVTLDLSPVSLEAEVYINILEQKDQYGNTVYERGDRTDYDVNMGLWIGNIDVGFNNKIIMPEKGEYTNISNFERISVSFGGKIELLLEAPDEGYHFDYLVNMFTNYWFKRNPDIGLIFEIIGNEYDMEIYFDLTANINLMTITEFKNIELYFNLTSKEAMDKYNSPGNILNRERMRNILASLAIIPPCPGMG